jgi:hypothetical protein
MNARGPQKKCIVGNQRVFLVVGNRGEIVWCRAPGLDSPSVFSQLIQENTGGTFSLLPNLPFEWELDWSQDCSVAETRYETVLGKGRIRDEALCWEGDFPLPLFSRTLEMTAGQMEWSLSVEPRFDFGLRDAICEPVNGIQLFRDSSLEEQEWSSSNYWVFAAHNFKKVEPSPSSSLQKPSPFFKGQLLMAAASHLSQLPQPQPESRIEILWGHGRESLFLLRSLQAGKISRNSLVSWRGAPFNRRTNLNPFHAPNPSTVFTGPWAPAAGRALRVIELLTSFESGNIFGSPLHSQTRVYPHFSSNPNAVRVSDLCRALLLWIRAPELGTRHGYESFALKTLQALLRFVERTPPDLYGTPFSLDETVRIRASSPQKYLKLDAHGWVLHALLKTYRSDLSSEKLLQNPIRESWQKIQDLGEWLCRAWRRPDLGLLSGAQRPSHFTASKAMAWLGIQSLTDLNEELGLPQQNKWGQEADLLHRTICEQGVDREGRFFTLEFGSQATDLSTLLLFQIGFLPDKDPRMQETLARLEAIHLQDGKLYDHVSLQNEPHSRGLMEWSFQFWWISALARDNFKAAQELFNRALTGQNAPFILGERWNPETREEEGEWPCPRSQIEFLHTLLDLQALSSPPKKGPFFDSQT